LRLLLDTHVFLWWRTDDPGLKREVRHAIARADVAYVSAASAWEMAIKSALGKLRIPGSVEAAVEESRFAKLPISFEHAEEVAGLPNHHTDPFDRMLLAQALVEGLTLVTRDRQFEPYRVPVIWT
jgi:PIN domain nuclease of toxin-antitoxin system